MRLRKSVAVAVSLTTATTTRVCARQHDQALVASVLKRQASHSLAVSYGNLSAPVTPPISFYWEGPWNAQTSTDSGPKPIQQCSQQLLRVLDNPASYVNTVPPLTLSVAPVGMAPYSRPGPSAFGGNFTWIADLPVGTNFSMAMSDSVGNSGGAVDNFYIIQGFSNCTVRDANNTGAMVLDFSPNDMPCDELDVEILGGQRPYTLSILSGLSGLYGNLTGILEGEVAVQNIVPAGQAFTVFVSDSVGQVSEVSAIMTSGLGMSTCALPDSDFWPPDDGGNKRSLGAIIGGAIGGVVAAVLLAALAWWFFRRRSRKADERYQAQEELVTKSEYKMADGRAPLVTPFVMTQNRGSDYEDNSSPTSAHPSLSPHDYPYGEQGPYSQSTMQSYPPPGQTTVSPVTGRHPLYSSTAASSSTPAYAPYDGADSPEYSTSVTVDGLADPREFAFREPGSWSTPTVNTNISPSTGPGSSRTLPPGAGAGRPTFE
ncbi:hypothetical protein OIV83_001413 [Microbotryomycetes sp. JL201]|nr:hypothetical protein OIV83_001413 [Microbotryomycetes sp. JL201]